MHDSHGGPTYVITIILAVDTTYAEQALRFFKKTFTFPRACYVRAEALSSRSSQPPHTSLSYANTV